MIFNDCTTQKTACAADAASCQNAYVQCVTTNQFKLLLMVGAFIGGCYYFVRKHDKRSHA